jgi:two-component system NarL family sensor kinase
MGKAFRSDDRVYGELSRVNNELINAQRGLVQRNVRLERAENLHHSAQAELERLVKERTLELEKTLSAFQEEIIVRRGAEEKLRQLSLHVLHVQDDERRRVARDLHDTTGQTLTALKIALSATEDAVAAEEKTSELFTELNGLTDQALREIRTTSYLLHPPLLDEACFASAASWYIDGFNKRSPIKVSLHVQKGTRLPNAVEIVLFRILQESLTNISKHSGSATVDVHLRVGDNVTILSVRDFGKGISPATLANMRNGGSDVGVGIAGMRERLTELGGKLEINSNSTGTVLEALVPNLGF